MVLSEVEDAMLVALQNGNMPRDANPIALALDARTLMGRNLVGTDSVGRRPRRRAVPTDQPPSIDFKDPP